LASSMDTSVGRSVPETLIVGVPETMEPQTVSDTIDLLPTQSDLLRHDDNRRSATFTEIESG
jgi:hypothetical protein